MTTRISRLLATGAVLLSLGSATTLARQAGLHHHGVPPLPPGLDVPDGHTPFLSTRAIGTQNYMCLQTAAGISWRFLGPQATLYVIRGAAAQRPDGVNPDLQIRQQIATHFLSANPYEPGLARPTWQHSADSSRVWGRVVASSTDPVYVEPGAIAWLLLETAGSETGSPGGAALAQTTYIHRLNTSGGVAPATGCNGAGDVGTTALVPYVTDYVFYRADRQ